MLRRLMSLTIAATLWSSVAIAENAPGVSATEVKIGGTFPFSGRCRV
jgi:branched-chain amino acid transport system substrate-binding protein